MKDNREIRNDITANQDTIKANQDTIKMQLKSISDSVYVSTRIHRDLGLRQLYKDNFKSYDGSR